MSDMYNVLWIDDEFDIMTSFQEECLESYNLKLIPFRTRKAGMEALDKDLDYWHAVLLDAKMFDESENEVADVDGLRKAKQHLDELKMKKYIPYFISTGQPGLISDEMFKKSFGDYYEKGRDDERLMKDIKGAIDKSEVVQVINRYKDVFEALDSLGIREASEKTLTSILVAMHYPAKDPNFNPMLYFNQLRQLLEYIFRACNEVGLVPDQCLAGNNINLNQSSQYLAGKNATVAGVRYGEQGERVIPEYIETLVRCILDFGNIHSHTVELSADDQMKIESIFRSKKSRYIIFGLTLQLCEVITWMADYIAQHNDKEVNLLYCMELPKDGKEYNGRELVPVRDEDGTWHCEECLVAIKKWEDGKIARLRDVQPNTSKTKDKYPYFAYFDII